MYGLSADRGQSSRRTLDTSAAVPRGGWQGAKERSDAAAQGARERERTPPLSGIKPPDSENAYKFEPCVYVSTMDVISGTHVDPEQAFIGLVYAEQTVGFDSAGATSDTCCIALDENTNQLTVMLQATGSRLLQVEASGSKAF